MMINIKSQISILGILAMFTGSFSKPPTYIPVQVGDFRGESVAFGDINKDGHVDIVAGGWWFENQGDPANENNWVRHTIHNDYQVRITELGAGHNTNDDFMHTLDANHDGLCDILGGSNSGHYFLNPGLDNVAQPWTGIASIPSNHDIHSGPLWDINGDGVTEEYVYSMGEGHAARWAYYTGSTWKTVSIHDVGSNYGAGVGDIDRDGDMDMIRPGAWYERLGNGNNGNDPEAPASWARHEIALGVLMEDTSLSSGEHGSSPLHIGQNGVGYTGHVAQIYAYDVDGDGLNDLITSAGHLRGVFWYKQMPDGTFSYRLIDGEVSQGHSTGFADIDNDGDPDLIVGKRYKSHLFSDAGTDPDPLSDDPVTLNMYELTPGVEPYWTKHVLAEDVTSGTDLDVADIDRDGDLDIVVTAKNRQGPWVLVNTLADEQGAPDLDVLFDGTQASLDNNWYAKDGSWELNSGELVAGNPDPTKWGHYFTNDEYTNFFLRFQYKTVKGNFGLYIRAGDEGVHGATGLQVDFGQLGGNTLTDGSVMLVTDQHWRWLPGYPIDNTNAALNEWNDMVVEVVGQTYKVYVNDELVIEQKDVAYDYMPATGKIALQVHQGAALDDEARIRNVHIWAPAMGDTSVTAVQQADRDPRVGSSQIFTSLEFSDFLTVHPDAEVYGIRGKINNTLQNLAPGYYWLKSQNERARRIFLLN